MPVVTTAVTAFFEKDTVPISNGHTFSNSLRLSNRSLLTQTLRLDVRKTTIEGGYLSLPDSLTLAPGEQRNIPLKFLASAAIIKTALQAYTVSYLVRPVAAAPGSTAANAAAAAIPSTTGSPAATAVFFTRLNEDARLLLQLINPVALLDPATNQAQASFYVSNEGLLPASIRIRLNAYPYGLSITQDNQLFVLGTGARRLFTYTVRSRSAKSVNTDYQLILQLTDTQGNVLTTGSISVQSLSSTKQFFNGSLLNAGQPANWLELNYINLSRYTSYFQFRGKGGVGLADSSRLDYKLNLEYYRQPSGLNLYDTWLSYSTSHFHIQAGGITDNLDYSITGNGITAGFFPDKKNSIEVFGVKNNYILYSQVFHSIPGADIAGLRYSYTTQPFSLQTSILHASDPLLDVYDNLLHSAARLKLGGHQDIQWEAGFSTEQPRSDNRINYGFSAGFKYHNETPQWSLALDDYYSSPYYSGWRRGALQLENEADFKLDSVNRLFGRYNKSFTSPRYTPTADSLIFVPFDYNNTDIYAAGYRTRWRRWSASLYPYYMTQKIYTALKTQASSLRSRSDRLALDLTWSGAGRSFYSNSDIGYTRTDSISGSPLRYSSIRLMGNFLDHLWGFNWLLQWRPYYLTDQLQSPDANQYKLYSFGPSIHFPFLRRQANFTGGYTLNYYSAARLWTQTGSAQLNFGLQNNWTANAQFYYTFYHGDESFYPDNKQFRVGLQKRFATGREPGMIRLRVLVFNDENGNGESDNGEKAARKVILQLDGEAAITDNRGKAEFDNLKTGVHQLTIDNGSEWNLAAPMSLPLLRDRTLSIPLVRSGRLKGRVQIQKQKYETVEPDREGIRIEAHGRNGKTFTTYTDAQGEFHFDVPVMEYELIVQAAGGSGAPSQRVKVEAGKVTEAVFQLEDRRRKIEVKQF